jgi:hypothetical protein
MGLRAWAESWLELPREPAPGGSPSEIIAALGPVLKQFAETYRAVGEGRDHLAEDTRALAVGMADLLSGVGVRLRRGR